MSDKFKFTQEDLDNMVLGALNAQPEGNRGVTGKPNTLEMLKAQAKLQPSKTKK